MNESAELAAFLEQFTNDLREVVVAAAVAATVVATSSIAEMNALRTRVESLERAHNLEPGTSMHANWEEGNE